MSDRGPVTRVPRPSGPLRRAYPAIVALLTALALGAPAQRSGDARREALTERIEATARLLASASTNRAAALDRLVGLQRQAAQREELIGLLHLEIAHADSSVGRTAAAVAGLERDADLLADEYGRLARAALRQNLLESRWQFLLDANSLTDAFRRVQYLRRYDEHRRRQLDLIEATRVSLVGKVARLDELRARKQSLLDDQLAQRLRLRAELAEADSLATALRGDARRLRAELADQRAARDALDAAVAEVIDVAAEATSARVTEEGRAEGAGGLAGYGGEEGQADEGGGDGGSHRFEFEL